MSRPEDAIDRARERVEGSVRTEGVIERVARRRRRRGLRQRAGSALLTVAVVGGSVLAIPALHRVFRPASTPIGGQVAFVRSLDPCPARPNVSGGLDVFAIDVATGAERLVSHVEFWPDGRSLRSEDWPDFTPDGSRFVWVDGYRGDLYVTEILTGNTTRLAAFEDLVPANPTGWVADVGGIGRPQVSPDGTRVVFAAAGGDPVDPDLPVQEIADTSSVYVVDISGGTAPVRVTAGHLPTWTADGRIAFARTRTEARIEHVGGGTSIYITPLAMGFFVSDADGSHVEEVYEAPADVQIADAEWSPDGSRIAAEVTMHGNTDIYVLDLETRQPLQLTDDPADDTSPTWSPDGAYIAFHTGRYGDFRGHAEIALISAQGGDVIRLTRDDCWADTQPTWIGAPTVVASLPIWTPAPLPDLGPAGAADPTDILVDGTFESVYDIYAVDPETGETTNLTADIPEQLSPAWSPDRSRLAFSMLSEGGEDLDLFVMNADGTDLHALVPGPESVSRPAWSPDGTKIAFEGEDGVWVVGADGSDPHHVAGAFAGGGVYPSWSPDGARIVFAQVGQGLFLVNADGSDHHQLTDGQGDYDPSWSPDGATIVFGCERDICLIRSDGTGRMNLTAGPEDTYELAPDWSPDGTTIVFVSDRGGDEWEMELWLMDADGGDPRGLELQGDLGSVHEPDW